MTSESFLSFFALYLQKPHVSLCDLCFDVLTVGFSTFFMTFSACANPSGGEWRESLYLYGGAASGVSSNLLAVSVQMLWIKVNPVHGSAGFFPVLPPIPSLRCPRPAWGLRTVCVIWWCERSHIRPRRTHALTRFNSRGPSLPRSSVVLQNVCVLLGCETRLNRDEICFLCFPPRIWDLLDGPGSELLSPSVNELL